MAQDINNRLLQEGVGEARPLLTLAILSYNQEDLIAEAIEGALEQTYSPLEIIISDDCSTDGTFDVIQNTLRGRQTPHEVLVNRNDLNLGVCAHVNKIFVMARGRLIVMNGGDDVSLPSRVQDVHEAWVAHGKPGAVHSEWIDIDENGDKILVDRPPVQRPEGDILDWKHPRFLDQVESARLFHYIGAALAYDPKAVFEGFAKLEAQLFNEDQVLPFRACLKGGFIYLTKPLLKYRQHSNNLHSLHKRRNSEPDLTLSEKEMMAKDLRTRRLLRYQAHVRDLRVCLESGHIDPAAGALQEAIEGKAAIVQLMVDWWDMKLAQRLKAYTTIAKHGTPQERRWAAKRLMPWHVFELLATKPWRRSRPPHRS